MEYDKYEGYRIRLKDAIRDLEVSNLADTAAKEAIHTMTAYLNANIADKVSTGNAVDGSLHVLNQKTTDAKNVREYFHDQLKAIRDECRSHDMPHKKEGGKKRSRRHKKKRGKRSRKTRTNRR